MMDELQINDKYIFFLKLNSELPDFYYKLAQYFSEFGLTLVPVEPDSLKEFSYIAKKHILVVRDCLESYRKFNMARVTYVDYLLKHSKIIVTDISSFSEIDLVKSVRLHKCYKFHKLPMNLKEIVIRVAHLYYNERKTQHRWPGGRRGKFPEMAG